MQLLDHLTAHGHFEIISLEKGQEVWRSPVIPNRILNAGLQQIIAQHQGTAGSLEITSLEVGDGTMPVAASDIALDNLVTADIPPARFIPSTTSVVVEFFVVDGELPNGTYTELGLRTGAVLYTRALFSAPYAKVAGRDTIIRYTLSYAGV